jgi:hypothetical protein
LPYYYWHNFWFYIFPVVVIVVVVVLVIIIIIIIINFLRIDCCLHFSVGEGVACEDRKCMLLTHNFLGEETLTDIAGNTVLVFKATL